METNDTATETNSLDWPTMYRDFEIKRNEYGTFNVPTINCFGSPSVSTAMRAIDSYVEIQASKEPCGTCGVLNFPCMMHGGICLPCDVAELRGCAELDRCRLAR